MTDITDEEMTAGVAAATNLINISVPGLERKLISDAMITGLVAAVVGAVDKVRAAQPTATQPSS